MALTDDDKILIAGALFLAGVYYVTRKKEPSTPTAPASSSTPSPSVPPPPPPAPAPVRPKSITETREQKIRRLQDDRDVLTGPNIEWIVDQATGEKLTLAEVDRQLAALGVQSALSPKENLERLRTQQALLKSSGAPYIEDKESGEKLTLAEVEKRIAALEKQ